MAHFFALLSRMKYINRWGLMRNTRPENISEHSCEVAMLAHALAELRNLRFGGDVDVGRVVLLALYHDAAEIFTGDLPTPVKYFSRETRAAFRRVENVATKRLLNSLPADLLPRYEPLLVPGSEDTELLRLVKAADRLSALIKCIEEERAGNAEFSRAARAQREAIERMHMPEADCFLEEFLPGYSLTLDEQEEQ